MPTQTLRLHKRSKQNIPWTLERVKELRQGKKTGIQIASFLNRSEVVIDTQQSPAGRVVQKWDIPIFARMSGSKLESRVPRGEPTTRRRRKKKAFDPFKMMQDILSSNLDESTQKVLVAMLAKGITNDA